MIVVVLGLRVIPELPGVDGPRDFDALGAFLITVGLIAITFGIVRTDTLGWGSPGVLAPFIAGLALLAAFAHVEARVARHPLVPLSIFRLRRLRAANIIVTVTYGVSFPGVFFITLYLQQVLHLSVIASGLAFLPFTLSTFAGATLASTAVARFGAGRVILGAMISLSIGMLALSAVNPAGSYVADVLVGGVLMSLGVGFSLVPSTIVAMHDVAPVRRASPPACSTPPAWSGARSAWPSSAPSPPAAPTPRWR